MLTMGRKQEPLLKNCGALQISYTTINRKSGTTGERSEVIKPYDRCTLSCMVRGVIGVLRSVGGIFGSIEHTGNWR